MNLKYGQFDVIERELEKLLPLHRVVFAAACCERLYPHYDIFVQEIRKQGWNEPDPIRITLDEIWEFLAGKEVDVAKFHQLLTHCEEYPYDYENEETPEGQRAVWIVSYTLELCLEQTPQKTISVIKQIHETLFEYIDYLMCQSEDVSWENIPYTQLVETVTNHPFTLREMAKQTEDLQRLQSTPDLTPEFLDSLRISSENGGRSLLDLS